jgi:molecular chaperone GrpE (heat shock protein)
MSLLTVPKTIKWPFIVGDALLLGLAWFFYYQAKLPFNGATLAACVACVAIGAVLGIAPFIMDYRAELKMSESDSLVNTVDQIRGLETIAAAVSSATGKWQGVHEHATEAVNSARQVSDHMSTEMKSFMEFLEKARDSERQHLTLEVDKLKRAESEWLGVLVHIMDHGFALHSAARRSGDEKVIDQLTRFQFACRDVARRVGLVPFEAEVGTEFDAQKHQVPDGAEVPAEARIEATMATGFTFRGQMIRPALVRLGRPGSPEPATESQEGVDETPTDTDGNSSEQELSL